MRTFSRRFRKEPWAVDWETFMGRRGDISVGDLMGFTVFIFNKPPTHRWSIYYEVMGWIRISSWKMIHNW